MREFQVYVIISFIIPKKNTQFPLLLSISQQIA